MESDKGAGTVGEGAQIEKGQELNVGSKVEYHIANQTTTGIIKDIVTEDSEVGGRTVKASEDEPRYIVENENTGKESALKKNAIEQVVEEEGSGKGGGSKGGSAQKSSGGKAKGGKKTGGAKKQQQQQEGAQGEEEDEEEEDEE